MSVAAAAALLPVLLFLLTLFLMDSFKLVRPGWIALALFTGGVAALGALWLHAPWLPFAHIEPLVLTRYVAPVVEEAAKAALIVLLITSSRIGFLVDAALLGFAVGTGFALVENIVFLNALEGASVSLWLVRGFGTAVLHGATTALFAIVGKALFDRRQENYYARAFLPAYLLAVVIHSGFNHLLLTPSAQAVVILIVVPLIVLWVFDRSERATREWVGAGLDLDVELLRLVQSEDFAFTRFGQYLSSLRARFPGRTVADMYCLLRLELELAVQAKAAIMVREAGLELDADEDLAALLAEREHLHRSIGRTGLLALKPLQVTSGRDRWHRHVLGGLSRRA